MNTKGNKNAAAADSKIILTIEEKDAVKDLSTIKEYKKGAFLLREGQHCKACYYIIEGIVRQFRIVDGEEKTSDFYTENQSVFSSSSALNTGPSKFSLDCLEDCKISIVPFAKEQEIYAKFPRFEKLCRLETEKNLVEFQDKFAKYMSSSPEQRYLDLMESNPNLVNRVPQYHLASYLGVKPESLSRIRKRIMVK